MKIFSEFFRIRLLIFFVPLLLAAPFLNRAFFVDDNYFVEIASWLKDHPTQPYDFRTDDAGLQNRGWEKDGFVRMVNPLVHHYYLAVLMKLGGARVWWLRLGCVLFSCFSALFIFELARRWTYHPVLATLLALVTPVFWLTSYSLLIDGTLGFFFFGALYFYVRSLEKESFAWSVASGIFMGLAILTKYPGLLIVPLSLAWGVLRWKKLTRKWLVFLPGWMGIMCLVAYSAWTFHLYGRAHILAASGRMVDMYGWAKIIVFLVFLSGSLILPLFAWPVVGARLAQIGILLGIAFFALMASSFGGYSLFQSLLMGLWCSTSVLFLIGIFVHRSKWELPKDLFLAIWVLGFVLMMLVVMGWVAVRYYMIVLPAVVFMVVRWIETIRADSARRVLAVLGAIMILFTGLLGYADYKQAAATRNIQARLEKDGFKGGERHFYLGDSFTMSYLKQAGWTPCFAETELKAGDIVLAKQVTMPQYWFFQKPLVLRLLAEYPFPTRFPIKVMDNSGSAGFYASVWGSLPFTFSQSPWEKFQLFEVVAVLPPLESQ